MPQMRLPPPVSTMPFWAKSRHQFRRRSLQHGENLVHNLPGRPLQSLQNLLCLEGGLLGKAGAQVPALDQHTGIFRPGIDATNGDFDLFGRIFSQNHPVLAADIAHNGLIHGVSCHLGGGGHSHCVHRQHRHVRGAAANVHHHMAAGTGNVQVGSQRGGQGFFDQVDPACAGLHGGANHRPLLHLRDAAGHTDNDTGLEQSMAGRLPEKLRQHPLGHLIVGNHAPQQRPHRYHIAWSPAQHVPGRRANLQNFARCSCPPPPQRARAGQPPCRRQ